MTIVFFDPKLSLDLKPAKDLCLDLAHALFFLGDLATSTTSQDPGDGLGDHHKANVSGTGEEGAVQRVEHQTDGHRSGPSVQIGEEVDVADGGAGRADVREQEVASKHEHQGPTSGEDLWLTKESGKLSLV